MARSSRARPRTRSYSEPSGCRRRSDPKRPVTCVVTSDATAGCKLFRQVYDEVAASYPALQKDYAHIDAVQQWLLRSPEASDVAVTTIAFGDIASDLPAVPQGGL